MNLTTNGIRRTAIAAAVATTIGTLATPVTTHATVRIFDMSGWFTMLNASGSGNLVNDDYAVPPMYGMRTPVSGTLTIDDATNTGSMTIDPFSFFGSGFASATTITFQDVDGPGGAGTLLLGNMGFNWNGTNGIPVSIVMDGAGLLDAVSQGAQVGDTIGASGTDYACDNTLSCATAATENFPFNFAGFGTYVLPIGPSPLVTTTFNTSDIGVIAVGTNPSGTLPLIADTIGGSPMKAGPFPGFNANFDFDQFTLKSDGSGSITAPAAVSTTIPENPLPAAAPINLGAPSNVAPPGTAEYCSAGSVTVCDNTSAWIADDGTNTINVPISQTVNTLTVDWRAGGGVAFDQQQATITVDDNTPPVIDSSNAQDKTVPVNSTSDNVCFGTITATDNVEPQANLTLEWSHDGFNWNAVDPTDNCSTGFGPNSNTITWRAIDASNNIATYQQTVTLNLPTGIVGKTCTIDLATTGDRAAEALFTMRGPGGAITPTGVLDTTVTGTIDTSRICADESCTDVGAALVTAQPFFGFLWNATPIRLFGPGTYTFESCPSPRSEVKDGGGNVTDVVSADGSNHCVDLSVMPYDMNRPNPLTMTVGTGQLGAHMLFEWAGNEAIDVAVVWDVDCKAYMLTATDPDGDGILASRMVDGPFKGWNAAFDVRTKSGEPPIADGGFTTSVPAVQNTLTGKSPLPLTTDNTVPTVTDSAAVRSCVGGCFGFTTTELQTATDGAGTYQYAMVVLPLDEALPFYSKYRKFDAATQTWGAFVRDSRNEVYSAPMDGNMACPEPGGNYSAPLQPGSDRVDDKLGYGNQCIELRIEDGGPNDADGVVNGSVTDPGGPAEVASPGLPATEGSGGGCSVAPLAATPARAGAWWLLAGFLGWLGWKRRRPG